MRYCGPQTNFFYKLAIIMYPDWLTCKKSLLGGHGKARHTVNQIFDTDQIIHHIIKECPIFLFN